MRDMLFRSRGSMDMEVLSSPASSLTATSLIKKLRLMKNGKMPSMSCLIGWNSIVSWREFLVRFVKKGVVNMLMLMKVLQI
jgi:hypothetical protein